MARPGSDHPTQLELEILKVLWSESPLPVRDVQARLEEKAERPLAHSSVITILNIMVRKGYLSAAKRARRFSFHPRSRRTRSAAGWWAICWAACLKVRRRPWCST